MIDVGVGDQNLANGELVRGEAGEDVRDVIAGINDDGITRNFVAENGAVAGEQADRKCFTNHGLFAEMKARHWAGLSTSLPRVGQLLFGRGRLAGGLVGQHRAGVCGMRQQHCQANGGAHENNRRPGGETGEQVGCAAGAEGGLRSLAAEGAGEIRGLALLQQDDTNQKERNDDMDDDEQNEHGKAETLVEPEWVGLVRRRGLEPLCLAALAPQASASANFATSARGLTHRLCGRSDGQSRGKYNILSGLLAGVVGAFGVGFEWSG